MVDLKNDIDWKSLIFGAAISAGTIIIASHGYDWMYLFSSIGLLYVGYNSKNIIYGAILGAIASIPMVILAYMGAFGELSGFYTTTLGMVAIAAVILFIGVVVGVVGAWGKISREKAKVEYEAQQKPGKNKNKKSTTKNIPKK